MIRRHICKAALRRFVNAHQSGHQHCKISAADEPVRLQCTAVTLENPSGGQHSHRLIIPYTGLHIGKATGLIALAGVFQQIVYHLADLRPCQLFLRSKAPLPKAGHIRAVIRPQSSRLLSRCGIRSLLRIFCQNRCIAALLLCAPLQSGIHGRFLCAVRPHGRILRQNRHGKHTYCQHCRQH